MASVDYTIEEEPDVGPVGAPLRRPPPITKPLQTAAPSMPAVNGGSGAPSASHAWIENMPFMWFCKRMESVANLKDFRKKFDTALTEQMYHKRKEGESLYPYMRLLLPELDRERSTYGLKATSIARIVIECLGLETRHSDARKLLDWRDPDKARAYGRHGKLRPISAAAVKDFASVVEDVLTARCPVGGVLTIGNINDLLDALHMAVNPEDRKGIIDALLRDCSAKEFAWVVRIILKDLKTGLRHERVLNHYHKDALAFYNATTDLKALCSHRDFADHAKTVRTTVQLMVPFSPMLCKRQFFDIDLYDSLAGTKTSGSAGSTKGAKIMSGLDFFIEDKLDGERMLVHKRGDDVMVFSRRTNRYAEYAECLAPVIRANVDCASCILDGEMMAWDSTDQRFIDFGSNRTIVNEQLEDPDSKRHLCYVAFDVLWIQGYAGDPTLNGDITGLSTLQRKQCLAKIVRPVPHRLELLPYSQVLFASTSERIKAIKERFETAIDQRREGVVMKLCNAPYGLNDRTEAWVKLKPDYMEGVSETLDVVIVGGYLGQGTRGRAGRSVSHFLLAVADRKPEEGPPGPTAPVASKFSVFCKVGSGYNVDELIQLQNLLSPHWTEVNAGRNRDVRLPAYLGNWKPGKRDDVPDVVIDPSKSVLVEIKGAELTPTDQFSAGYALRFPRVLRLRLDKGINECLSLSELRQLVDEMGGKLARKRKDGQYVHTTNAKRRKKLSAVSRKAIGLGAEYLGADVRDVETVVPVLAGKDVYVMSQQDYSHLPEEYNSKGKLEVLVAKLGGSVVQNNLPGTHVLVASSRAKLRVQTQITAGTKDIMKPEWLIACLDEERLVEPEPRYCIFMCEATRKSMEYVVDKYGDHFTRHTTPEELKAVFALMRDSAPEACSRPTADVLAFLEEDEAVATESKFDLFKEMVVYLDDKALVAFPGVDGVIHDPLSPMFVIGEQVRMFGGTLSNVLDVRVTHVLVAHPSKRDKKRVAEIQRWAKSNGGVVPVLLCDWVPACIAAGKLLAFK